MKVFPISGPATKQPQGLTRVNWENPLARDLRALFNVAVGPIDLTTGVRFTPAGTIVPGVGVAGRKIDTHDSGNRWHAPDNASTGFSASRYDKASPPVTLFGVGYATQNPSQCFIVRPRGSSTPTLSVGAWTGSFRGGHANVALSGGTLIFDPPSAIFETAAPNVVVSILVVDTGTTTLYSGYPGRILDVRSQSTPSGTFSYEYGDENRCLSVGGSFNTGGGTYTSGLAWRAWTLADVQAYFNNPWQLFEDPEAAFFFTGAGATTHPTSGALAAQDATLAGTATHLTLHTSSGAIEAQSATVAGAALHPHTTTGALEATAAEVAGSADHTAGNTFTTEGALAAQSAVVEGTSTHLTLHTTTGALESQAATVAGSAVHPHITTGALEAQAATASGAAAHEHAVTGALAAGAATVAGDAVHAAAGTFEAVGDLLAQEAQVSGVAELIALVRDQPSGGWFDFGANAPRKKRKKDDPPELQDVPLVAGDPTVATKKQPRIFRLPKSEAVKSKEAERIEAQAVARAKHMKRLHDEDEMLLLH